jgi:hypothetical protein
MILLDFFPPEHDGQRSDSANRKQSPSEQNPKVESDLVFGIENDGSNCIADSEERCCHAVSVETWLQLVG